VAGDCLRQLSLFVFPARSCILGKKSGTQKFLEVAEKYGILGILVKFLKNWIKFKQIWIFSFWKTWNSPILFVLGLTGKHKIPGISLESRRNFFS
jgi:hypothetical protein